nr:retrovirus-related Pol polyprotein from transposon TNT 1-94 [Tanacetum cinerariifolium]
MFKVDRIEEKGTMHEAPTAQTMFMANLSSADPVYDEVGSSYALDILSETKVVDKSLTAKLATYKEQVELYERRARFELTEREQKINEQLRIVITDCNIKEEKLKKELHSVKMKLAFTINHNKSMALTTEIKEMKAIFDELEAEVDQNTVNRKCDEIERKNLLIGNDTLIANCFSKEVFYIAMNSELNVTPPKMRVEAEYCTGALLHNITATDT